jgi:hypothetical protein
MCRFFEPYERKIPMKNRLSIFIIILAVVLSACVPITIQIGEQPTTTPTHDSCRGIPEPCYDYTADDIIGSFKNETVVFECSGGCDIVAVFPAGTLVDAVCQANGWCVDPRLGGYFEKKFVEGY